MINEQGSANRFRDVAIWLWGAINIYALIIGSLYVFFDHQTITFFGNAQQMPADTLQLMHISMISTALINIAIILLIIPSLNGNSSEPPDYGYRDQWEQENL